MGYSNTWSTTSPTESSAANTIALFDRQTRLNVQERINSIIGVPIGTAFADPIVDTPHSLNQLRTDVDAQVALTAPLFAVVNQEMYIHGSAGHFSPATYAPPALIDGGLHIDQAVHGASAQILYDLSAIPIGATLVSLTVYWNSFSAPSTLQIYMERFNPPAFSTIISNTGALPGGAPVTTVLPAARTIAAGEGVFAYLKVALVAAATMDIYALKVIYNTPNANIRR